MLKKNKKWYLKDDRVDGNLALSRAIGDNSM
jgi:hypothetical protein